MEIEARHTTTGFVDVTVVLDGTTVSLGLLDEEERDALAAVFLDAAYDIGPKDRWDCETWYAERLEACGIDLPSPEPVSND